MANKLKIPNVTGEFHAVKNQNVSVDMFQLSSETIMGIHFD